MREKVFTPWGQVEFKTKNADRSIQKCVKVQIWALSHSIDKCLGQLET